MKADAKSAPRRPNREVEALKTELKARIAETEWLKQHYDEQLRAAFAQVATLQALMRSAAVPPEPDISAMELRRDLGQMKAEVERLRLAETRYLDRIEELKELNRAIEAR